MNDSLSRLPTVGTQAESPEQATASGRGLEQLDLERIGEWFGPSSPISQTLPGYEYREAQQAMAVAVAQVFRDGGELLVEAGTGTGKTLAYLIPAALSGQRVVISTGTKNLQEQLFYKDIPLVRKALKIPFSACLMKGRGNYLCRSRYAQFSMQPKFRFFEESEHFDRLHQWANVTKTGDRSEIPGVPERLDFWSGISARSENCIGKDCGDFDQCYVTQLRQRAAESELIVVNHHLLFADLQVRLGSYGEVIPEYDFVVLDEAHQLEDIATQYFGLTVSSARVEELLRDIQTTWETRASSGALLRKSIQSLKRCRSISQQFFESFRAREDRYRITPATTSRQQRDDQDKLNEALRRVRAELDTIPDPDESSIALARRASEIELDLQSILNASDPENVSWCESRERSRALRSSPINVADRIRDTLLETKRAIVMTSATLAVEGSFDYVTSRLGTRTERQHVLPSPFDYHDQALLYLPRHLPAPRDASFQREATVEIRRILAASRGRAFLLFTSFANLHAVRRALTEDKQKPFGFPVLVQGDAPRGELLEQFRETPGAVLFGTSSFWEGVDVVGEQLSAVVIDKLPFAVPGDPLISARIDWLESRGGNGFRDYQVPMAILSLKQGLGRLIRSRRDRGIVSILDSRLASSSYGERFLASMPPFQRTHEIADVERFFATSDNSADPWAGT